MNVLLVYPQFPDTTFWRFNHALRFIGKKASLPPIGLLTVAAILPGIWTKRLIDMNIYDLTDSDIEKADLVMISAMSVQKKSAMDVIDRCTRLGVPTVAGGPLFTAYPEQFPDVSHLVLNEAEITLPLFLRDLADGCAKRIYSSTEFADMSESPVPAWDLIRFRDYASMGIQYSRGCPYNCDFCDITVLFGHRHRIKPIDSVIIELDALYMRGWRGNVFFVDDNLIGNKKVLKETVLPALITWMKKRRYPFRFQTQLSVDLAEDDELLDMIAQAGFEAVFVGIETPDENVLHECGKHQNTNRDLLACVRKMQKAGLQVQAGFIVGFDSDTTDIFTRMSRFINESGIVTSMVGILNAPKGSRLYKRLVSENRLIQDPTGDNTDFSLNFIPKMDRDVLVRGYRKVIHDIYHPEKYYQRLKTFLKNYQCSTRFEARRRFSRESFRALGMSVYYIGMKRGMRKQFWHMMLWTLLKRPKSLPLAINLSIYSYQFMRFYEIEA